MLLNLSKSNWKILQDTYIYINKKYITLKDHQIEHWLIIKKNTLLNNAGMSWNSKTIGNKISW